MSSVFPRDLQHHAVGLALREPRPPRASYWVACVGLIDFQELFTELGSDTLLLIGVANISSQTEAGISCFIDGIFC